MATSTITNTVTTPGGTPLAGVPVIIRLMPAGGFRGDGSEVARIHHTTTDNSGVWSATLERNADITPSGTYYEVEEKIPGAPRRYLFQVGGTSATLQASLITVPPAVDVPTALTQDAADSRYVLAPGTFGTAGDISEVSSGPADGGALDAYARIDHRHRFDIAYGSTAARDVAIPSPAAGDLYYLATNNSSEGLYAYNSGGQWRGPWNLPWGYITSSEITSDSAGFTTSIDITSVTFTAVANRRYKISASAAFQSSIVGDHLAVQITTSADVALQHGIVVAVVANRSESTDCVYLVSPPAGSITYKMRGTRLAGTGTVTMKANSTIKALLLVEDIGPSGAPA